MMGLRPYFWFRRPALDPHRNDLLEIRALIQVPPQVEAVPPEFLRIFEVCGRFPWAPGQRSYPPGLVLGSVFLWGGSVDRNLSVVVRVLRDFPGLLGTCLGAVEFVSAAIRDRLRTRPVDTEMTDCRLSPGPEVFHFSVPGPAPNAVPDRYTGAMQ